MKHNTRGLDRSKMFLGPGERSTAKSCAPHQLWLCWPGGVVRGILWIGGDPAESGNDRSQSL